MNEVRDNPQRSRYELTVDGELAAWTEYTRKSGSLTFVHTETDPRFEGRGMGSALAREALDDVRGRGLRVVPVCPFVAHFIDRHPEYADLVDEEALAAARSTG